MRRNKKRMHPEHLAKRKLRFFKEQNRKEERRLWKAGRCLACGCGFNPEHNVSVNPENGRTVRHSLCKQCRDKENP